jgi:hypothetical protein
MVLGRTCAVALVAVVLATSTAGCSAFKKEYTWTRKDPALFRRSPTTFSIRLNVQPAQGRVLWLQAATDSDGVIGTEIDTLAGCTFFDPNNWEWEPGYGFDRHVSMRGGKLHESYWGEERNYRTAYRIFGHTFTFDRN